MIWFVVAFIWLGLCADVIFRGAWPKPPRITTLD